MAETPEWLQNFKCKWKGEKLTELPETLPPTIEDYLSLIGPGDWKSTLDQIMRQEDHCIFLDTGVSFSSNWSDTSDEEDEEDDGPYSKKMVFCAGPVKKNDVESHHFLQFLSTALEQRLLQEGLSQVDGQKEFCQFVKALGEGVTTEVSVKQMQEDDDLAVNTEGQEPTTSKRQRFDYPTLPPTRDIRERARGTMQVSVKQEDDTRGRTMDNPIKLTSMRVVDGQRQVFISPEAEKIFSNLAPRSVDVVAVVGPMRKGKSHLANLLCKTKSGFELGDEMESKTKDFWFWIGPHPVHTNRYLMVVDTEGLGDYSDEEQNEKDLKYLVLATLLSNHLVFNLQGNPDHSFVPQLRLMGDLSEHVRVQKDGSDEGNNLGDHFPELWVTVQQAHRKPPQREGRRLTHDEFLGVMLERKDGQTRAIRSHNEITAAVKAFFPKRHLRLIPTPSLDSDILCNLDKVGDNVLQTDYKETVDNFTREIWNSGQVNRVNGDDIRTTGLLHIMKYFVNAINDPNAMPSVLGAHEAMVEGECRRALDEQMKQFQKNVRETVKSRMPMDVETCKMRIKTATASAVPKLSAEVGKWDKDGTWKKLLQEKLDKERLALLEANGSKSKDLCNKIMEEVGHGVQKRMERGDYTEIGGCDMYDRDMDEVYRTYKERASGKGPAVEKILKTFRDRETTRRNMIKDTARKLEEKDRLVEDERKMRQEAGETAERVAERAAASRGGGTGLLDVLGLGVAGLANAGLYALGEVTKFVNNLANARVNNPGSGF